MEPAGAKGGRVERSPPTWSPSVKPVPETDWNVAASDGRVQGAEGRRGDGDAVRTS